MTTLKQKMEMRNLGLTALYWIVRPATWVLMWCLVDFAKMVRFHMFLDQFGHRIYQMGIIEGIRTFLICNVWPMAFWLVMAVLIDIFVVAPIFKSRVIQIDAKGI